MESLSLDKRTGKKCYMLAARDLQIVWGDTPKSQYTGDGFHYQNHAEVSIGISGLENQTKTVFLEPEGETRRVRPVVPRRRMGMFNRGRVANPNPVVPISPSTNGNGPKQRKDGWMEIELGEYFIKEGEEGELEI
ncbi:F-box domain, cyclin-like protein [Artemisia annua]|uniref:F-box domain, cyclin-like protein n=1 Tax=Artemisia annua TaxID=35608 RepID=A0A2U1MHT5_ARTAN|nr:F-box domain, cyclin-like protein [Artemisia annua]